MKNLTDIERTQIGLFLLENSKGLRPCHGKIGEASRKWNKERKTIREIWARTKASKGDGQLFDVTTKRKGKTSRPKVLPNYAQIEALPYRKRRTIRILAKNIGVSKAVVGRWIKNKLLMHSSNAIKPALTDENKIARLQFCLSSLYADTLTNTIKFKSMDNHIHMDEKWFYLTKENQTVILTPGEVGPHRTTQSKRFITKVMFMSVVARPQYAEDGSLLWDGHIGIFPFCEKQPAKRRSKYRPAGTMVSKPCENVNKDVTRSMLINQIIPAIKAKWPANASKSIVIQQDNAPPHIEDSDEAWNEAANSDGWNIRLVFQPPNSPDFNINDLGFFNSIQLLQDDELSLNVDQLLDSIRIAFDKHSATLLNYNFLSLQAGMIESMKVNGHNNFPTPHMGKEGLERAGELPTDLQVDSTLVRDCFAFLEENGTPSDNIELLQHLEENPDW